VSCSFGNEGPIGLESAEINRLDGLRCGFSPGTSTAVTTVTKTITVAAGVFAPGRAAGATISFQDLRVARRLAR
jgi:hypothetical protein